MSKIISNMIPPIIWHAKIIPVQKYMLRLSKMRFWALKR
jgi:hypothetical protein